MPVNLWTEEEKLIVNAEIERGVLSGREIGALIGRTKQAISYYCFKNKLSSKRPGVGDRIYSHNENYFSEKTLENCYYAGFLMSDGSIVKDGNGFNLQWGCAEKDFNILKTFAEKINFNGIIKDEISREGSCKGKIIKGGFPQKKLSIYGCKQIVSDLAINFGVTPNKTYRNVVQNFENEDQKLAFAMGLVDGDGSVVVDPVRNRLIIKLCGCSLSTLEWFDKTIRELKLPKIWQGRERGVTKRKEENCYYCQICGVEAAFLYKKLINLDVPKLFRKWYDPAVIQAVNATLDRWNKSKHNKSNKIESFLEIDIKSQNFV
jgi:hypothetical protein